jgi:hypothetical protein
MSEGPKLSPTNDRSCRFRLAISCSAPVLRNFNSPRTLSGVEKLFRLDHACFAESNAAGVPLRQRVSAYSAASFFNISTALVFLEFSSSDFL